MFILKWGNNASQSHLTPPVTLMRHSTDTRSTFWHKNTLHTNRYYCVGPSSLLVCGMKSIEHGLKASGTVKSKANTCLHIYYVYIFQTYYIFKDIFSFCSKPYLIYILICSWQNKHKASTRHPILDFVRELDKFRNE